MNDKTTIIGLCGPAGCGKDTVRYILECNHDFTGLSFADPIRDMLYQVLRNAEASVEYMTKRELKEAPIPGLGVSYRHLAQTLGTEWGRNCVGPDFWLNVAANHMAGMRKLGRSKFVVSDVRFANEAEWVRAKGGVIWKIDRPGLPAVRQHVSEEMNFPWDYALRNAGSLDDLCSTVYQTLNLMSEASE
jgi:hypothetical protein